MTKQPKALLEYNFIQQLFGLGYSSVKIQDGNALVSNLKANLKASYKSFYRTYLFKLMNTCKLKITYIVMLFSTKVHTFVPVVLDIKVIKYFPNFLKRKYLT